MIIKVNFLLVCILIFLVSCKDKQQKEAKHTEFSVPVDPQDPILLSNILKDYDLIVLETTEQSMLGEIIKTQVHDDQFYLLSNNAIYVFEQSGKFKQKINNRGRGPDEYAGISDFDIYSGVLYLLDRSNQSVLEFDLNGQHLNTRSIHLWAQKLIVINEGEILLYSGEEDNGYNQCKFSRLLKNGAIIGSIPIDHRKSKFLHVNSLQNFVRYESEIYFHEAFNDTVFVIDDEQVIPKYSFHYEGSNIPNSFFDKDYENIYTFFQDFNETSYVNGTHNLFFSAGYIYYTAYRNKKAQLFSVNTSNGLVTTSPYILDDVLLGNARISAEDLNICFSNCRLLYFLSPLRIPEDTRQITNSDLNNIISTVSEESNPVIALSRTQK